MTQPSEEPRLDKPYLRNIAYCEAQLARFGDSYRGVGWTKRAEDVSKRYDVMLDVIRPTTESVRLLDFGCGLSHLLEHIRRRQDLPAIEYHGLDLSERFLELSRRKFPSVPYFYLDVLDDDSALPTFDYVVMNGVLTVRDGIARDEMVAYCHRLLETLFAHATVGLAFNVMSKYVDWERDDLFHVPFDELMEYLVRNVSRHVVFRHDYGLYEFTTYVYREPVRDRPADE
jgi:SAM-dependent methyltransferase